MNYMFSGCGMDIISGRLYLQHFCVISVLIYSCKHRSERTVPERFRCDLSVILCLRTRATDEEWNERGLVDELRDVNFSHTHPEFRRNFNSTLAIKKGGLHRFKCHKML